MTRTGFTAPLFALVLALGCGQANSSGEATAANPATEATSAEGEGSAPEADAEQNAVIRVRDYGEIRLQLYPDRAPVHVENFKKLARSGFYDGSTFHRIIPNFMIQGGDPNTKDDDPTNDGRGGPGYTIKAEFNDTPHKRGIVSMARASHPDSAGSQFFIVVKDSQFLDGKYTVFGEVTSGMDVADKIVMQPRDKSDRPNENIVIEAIEITGTDAPAS